MNIVWCECGEARKSGVVETRTDKFGGIPTIWRKRRCLNCGNHWRTMEVPFEIGKEVLSED